MHYKLSDIAHIVGASSSIINDDQPILHLLIDSRRSDHAENVLFFAIKGERHDAHAFLGDVFGNGIRNFVVSDLPGDIELNFPGASFLVVPNVLAALQNLASCHRKNFSSPVIGITGSNGKTIVKEWLWQLLRDDRNVVRSPKSYNSQVGVPLSVWQMNAEHDLAIFEAGISRHGEMEKLREILQPTIGILTNIGSAHDENFSSKDQKLQEKMKLFSSCGILIHCKDDESVRNAVAAMGNTIRSFTWSRKTKADLQIAKVSKANDHTVIQGIIDNRFAEISIPFIDDASVENAIHCWSTLLCMGIDQETITARMSQLIPVAMRLELKEGVNNCSVINDTYNSDIGSLIVALDFLRQQKQYPKRTLILSDILQSGLPEKDLYTEVVQLIRSKNVDRFIGVGPALSRCREFFGDLNAEFFDSTPDLITAIHSGYFHQETILLKGARAFEFEHVSKLLQQKAHETVLEIDLNALIHNLNYIQGRLNPGTKLMVMVKAFSYGSGSFEIANLLQFHHVDHLAVAYADEGVELRKAGITLPIMVMNPEEPGFDDMIRYDLEPEIFSFRVLQLFENAAKNFRSRHPEALPVPVHIKFDTGMRRLGFEEQDLNELIVRLKNSRDLVIRSVFSHLAASDEKEHDEFTRGQLKKFVKMSDELRSHFNYPIIRHLLNSSGILRFPDAQFEMVRLGIGLYGIANGAEEQKHLREVSVLKTRISQIRNVPAGETIGYSRKGKAGRNMRVATVPIGYADGLSRRLSNGVGKMFINGKTAPIIGNVCMDMCMLDIADIECSEGDEVVVFGKDQPIEKIAADMGTIAYEVLTNVSRRVKRVYFQE